MLPGMAEKPRVAIVGAGNLGRALVRALVKAGYKVEAIVARSARESRKRAAKIARAAGGRASTDLSNVQARLVWFCVPDAAIAIAARELASGVEWKGRIALHSSGALSSSELAVLRQRGAAVASVHPLMTFVRGAQPSFVGVPFAVEGDAAAVRVARRVVAEFGGHSYPIRRQDKVAYHAWGTFASPLFTALLATTERVAGLAGVKAKQAKRRMVPILMQTLANYAAFDAGDAFSGPIIRGDVDTVKRHLQLLRGDRAAREVYRALAGAALEYLPSKNTTALKRLIKD